MLRQQSFCEMNESVTQLNGAFWENVLVTLDIMSLVNCFLALYIF